MHFWIDKRSPQCGFGRSRVAASLHTGSSSLSFGHPPRRSVGYKSSSLSTAHLGNYNASTQGHRQQHHHHQQQQQPASVAQCHTHSATTSNNTPYRATNHPSGSSNNNNNTNNIVSHGTNRNFVRSNPISSHHYHNNNRHQQQSSACVLPNSSNNNQANLSGAAQSLVSPNYNNFSTPLNTASVASSTTIVGTHHHAQRYRHPQFGNLSVRTYQPAPVTTSTLAFQQAQMQLQQPNVHVTPTTIISTNNAIPLNSVGTAALQTTATTNQLQESLDASLNTTLNEHRLHESPNQTANPTVELYQQQMSPRIASTFNRNLTASTMSPAICDYNNVSSNLRTTYANSTLTSTITNTNHHPHHSQQPYFRRRRNSLAITQARLLVLMLKCAAYLSAILVLAFFVAIKFDIENHATNFEIGIFWLLTATFIFTFCFVSICKVPKRLFGLTTSNRSISRDQTRDHCSMDEAMGHGSLVNSLDDAVITGLHEFQQEQIQNININAQAGPPPYHIAILLPETKAKEDITTLEESPPPSYDKILI